MDEAGAARVAGKLRRHRMGAIRQRVAPTRLTRLRIPERDRLTHTQKCGRWGREETNVGAPSAQEIVAAPVSVRIVDGGR